MNLPAFSIRRPVTVMMVTLIAILLGFVAFVNIPVDLMPETEYPTLTVAVNYPGVGPQEMENLIARPLEQSLSSTPGVEEITSSASEGSANVRVSFTYGMNLDEAANEVRTRIDRRRGSLPEDADPPVIYKFDVSQFPIMFLTAASDKMDGKELRFFVEKNIQYRLERVPGVAEIRVRGGLRRQIQVNLDLKKVRALNLSLNQIVNTLRAENLNLPVGPVMEGKYELLVRTQGEFKNLEQIRNVVIASRGGVPIYLKEIASVEDGNEDIRGMISQDGSPAVRIFINKQSGANTVEVSKGVKDEMARIEKDYPDFKMGTTLDSAEFIQASINNVKDSAIQGAGLAVIVLLFFLRNVLSTMVIGVAIPIAVISTFALMYFNGFTLNIVSFGGLALGIGMLVDNSIVVLENIYRHMEMGKPRLQAALEGSREVAAAITSSTLTTLAVFVPVLFSQGVSAQTFKQLAVVVSFSLAASLLVALTIVPMMSSKFLNSSHHLENRPGLWGRLYRFAGFVPQGLSRTYGHVLRLALSQKTVVILVALSCIGASVYLGGKLGFELQPELDEGELGVDIELEPGTRVAETDAIMQRLRKIVVANVPELKNILIESGSDGGGYRGGEGQNRGEMRITLVPRSERERSAPEVLAAIRPLMQVEPGMRVQARLRGSFINRLSRGFGDGDRLAVEVRGYDLDVLNDLGTKVLEAMSRVKGAMGPRIAVPPGNPEMVIRVDRAKASSLGLNVADIAQTMETAIGGKQASMFRQDGDEFNILVRLQETDRLDLAQLSQIPLTTPNGMVIPAGSVVNLQRREGPSQIQRKNQQRILTVSAALQDRDLGSTVRDLDAELRKIDLPDGYSFNFGSEYEEQEEAFQQMLLAVILAITLVYMVMAAQFESLRDPFIILFSIPVAAIGVVTILLATNTSVTIQALLGIIVLVGIVVNNGIVLVDYANQLRRDHGVKLYEAVIQAGEDRLRPIIMTTATTVLGLVPMAIGLGEGSELQTPLARVVIGGLTASTLITLVLIPVLYMIFEQLAERSKERAEAREKNLRPEPSPASGD
ncbi:MAG: efflux RND transporter permease subunit [Bryobacterales bacterium]|nr:efflux RND transporter permease subunit [Bryobacterales bacterium]